MVDLNDIIRFDQPENRLTSLFMFVLEHTDHKGLLAKFLDQCDLTDQDPMESFEFSV